MSISYNGYKIQYMVYIIDSMTQWTVSPNKVVMIILRLNEAISSHTGNGERRYVPKLKFCGTDVF